MVEGAGSGRIPDRFGERVEIQGKMASTRQNDMQPLHDDEKKHGEYEYEDKRTWMWDFWGDFHRELAIVNLRFCSLPFLALSCLPSSSSLPGRTDVFVGGGYLVFGRSVG